MIELKDAATIALQFIQSMYPKRDDFEIEEVDKSDDEIYWLITVGMKGSASNNPSFFNPLMANNRQYKTVAINGETGEIKSMKIRPVK